MVGYQRLGTSHLPRPREKVRSGSDPTSSQDSVENAHSSKMDGAALFSSRAVRLGDGNEKLLK
jgi:hypothetical protein